MPTFNKASIAGLKDYPIKDGGWMAPTGEYYSTPHKNHEAITPLLTMVWYGEERGRRALEERGWIMVKHDGDVWFVRGTVTNDQLNALVPLLENAPDDGYHAKMKQAIEMIARAIEAR